MQSPAQFNGNQNSDNSPAQNARLLQHFLERDTRLDTFVNREFLAKQDKPVTYYRSKGKQNNRSVIGDIPGFIINGYSHEQQSGNNQTARPARVQDSEPLGLFLREDGCDNGVDISLNGTVSETSNNRTPIQHLIAVSLPQDQGLDYVTDETEDHRLSIADLVDHQTEEDDTDGERPEPGSKNLSLLSSTEPKLTRPGTHQLSTHLEAESCRNQGYETAPENPLVATHITLRYRSYPVDSERPSPPVLRRTVRKVHPKCQGRWRALKPESHNHQKA